MNKEENEGWEEEWKGEKVQNMSRDLSQKSLKRS